jgi:hypothetical protein
MEINILGQKMRIWVIIVCFIIGGFIGVNMFCSCAGGVKEGFNSAADLMGAALNYQMGQGVKGSWDKPRTDIPRNINQDLEGNILIVRQESIKVGVINWLKESGNNHWQVFTANQFIHSGVNCSQMLVVGLTQDYPISLFNSVYPEGGISTFSHSWIKEQEYIPGYFSDIAQVKIEKKIIFNLLNKYDVY